MRTNNYNTGSYVLLKINFISTIQYDFINFYSINLYFRSGIGKLTDGQKKNFKYMTCDGL